MRIFSQNDAYDFEKFPKTSARKQNFLVNEGGKEAMCEIVEEYAREVAQEQAEEAAYTLFKEGVSFEVVKVAFKNLTEEKLKEICERVMSTTK